MATHSSILAWKVPWTEEPGSLQFMRSQRVRHDWSDLVADRYLWVKDLVCCSYGCQETVTVYSTSMFLFASWQLNHREFFFCFYYSSWCLYQQSCRYNKFSVKENQCFTELICICMSDLAMPFLCYWGKQNDFFLPSFWFWRMLCFECGGEGAAEERWRSNCWFIPWC